MYTLIIALIAQSGSTAVPTVTVADGFQSYELCDRAKNSFAEALDRKSFYAKAALVCVRKTNT